MWMNESVTPNVQLMRQRVQHLYQRGGSASQRDDLLAAAFEELELAIEQLQQFETQQRMSYEEWLNERAELEVASQHYQHLFNTTPAGYLVTSLEGTIRNANPTAAKLLECTERQLTGRSIALFVPEGQRREFRAQIAQISQSSDAQQCELAMQSWERKAFMAGMTAVAVRGKSGDRPIAIHWLLHALADQKQAEPVLLEQQVGGAQTKRANGAPLAEDETSLSALARQRFLLLAQISVQLISAPDIDTMLGLVADLAVPNIADACVIDLADCHNEHVRRLVAIREHGRDQTRRVMRSSLPNASYTQAVAADRTPAALVSNRIDAVARQELDAILRPLDPSAAIFAPIMAGEQRVGSVTLVLASSARQYNPIDVALAEELARQIGDAAARLR